MNLFRQFDPTDVIKRALAEDVGQGDITTAATVAPDRQAARGSPSRKATSFSAAAPFSVMLRHAGAEPDFEARR